MTKKQIEGLKIYFEIIVENAHRTGDFETLRKGKDEINTLLDLMFETYLIPDYSEIDRIRSEVIGAGLKKYRDLQAAG